MFAFAFPEIRSGHTRGFDAAQTQRTSRWRFSRCAPWNSGSRDSNASTLAKSRERRGTKPHNEPTRSEEPGVGNQQALGTWIRSFPTRSFRWSTQPTCNLSSWFFVASVHTTTLAFSRRVSPPTHHTASPDSYIFRIMTVNTGVRILRTWLFLQQVQRRWNVNGSSPYQPLT